jgi:choline dehydrogenase
MTRIHAGARGESYDVVVVGGGAAGCVVASRLSETADRTVLLLEAGRDFPPERARPRSLADPRVYQGRDYCWQYQGRLGESGGPPTTIVRGRVIGGSGAINAATMVRGLAADYDGWGTPTWSWPQVVRAFCRMEDDREFTDDYHGTGGPMPVWRQPLHELPALDAAFYDAARSGGFRDEPDINQPQRSGVGRQPRNILASRRVDTAVAYLDPVRDRPNLTVRADSVAQRVIWNGTRAVGLELESGGSRSTVDAAEIVLCAGALGSPQLLFASGVGPAGALRRAGIPLRIELPGVGENLQDHPLVSIALTPREEARPRADDRCLGTRVAIYYTASGSTRPSDIQICMTSAAPVDTGVARASIACILNAELSTGRLRFTGPRVTDLPAIEYGYLGEPSDVVRLRDAVRTAGRLITLDPLSSLLVATDGPSPRELDSDPDLDRWIRENLGTGYHTMGTCRMGDPADRATVVDDQCRVLGTSGVRVVDLSIVPRITRASAFATAVMIGERAADLITAGT